MAREMPARARMTFYGIPHHVDLVAIRQRLVHYDRLAIKEAGPGLRPQLGVTGIAARIGISHMTLRRLLSGESVSLDSLHRILAGIGLAFGDVVRPVQEESLVA